MPGSGIGLLLIAGGLAVGGWLSGTRAPTVIGVILLLVCSWTLRRWVPWRR